MYHALLNNSEDGDVEVFEALSLSCVDCGEETIVRVHDNLGEQIDACCHQGNCRGRNHLGVKFAKVSVGWAYAFGSEGHAWNDTPVCRFKTEAEALSAARDALQDELNEAALARGFDADGREVA